MGDRGMLTIQERKRQAIRLFRLRQRLAQAKHGSAESRRAFEAAEIQAYRQQEAAAEKAANGTIMEEENDEVDEE